MSNFQFSEIDNVEPPTSAVLIRRNDAKRIRLDGLSRQTIFKIIAEVGPKYFAGYILNPQSKTVEESRKL